MRQRHVLVQVLPSRIDVVSMNGGRVVAARRLPINGSADSGQWAKGLLRHGGLLAAAVQTMGVAGQPAIVLYRSPTESVDLGSLSLKASDARQAAVLACLEALPYPAESAVSASTLVGRDSTQTPARHHVIAAAERDDVAEVIVQFIEGAGLVFDVAAPIGAVLMAHVVTTMLRERQDIDGRLYIGEHGTFFVVSEGGNLLFARQINMGNETVVAALTRPIRIGPGIEPVELSADAARQILYAHGRPERDAVVNEEHGIVGGQLAPLMQPVLQRFIIELRQSMRFGLNDEQRGRLALRLTGPGAAVPGLGGIIAGELQTKVTTDSMPDGFDWEQPGAPGSELRTAAGDYRVIERLNIQPRELAHQRGSNRLKRWFWVGAAAALAVIGFDAARYHLRLVDIREQAEAVRAQATGETALRETMERQAAVMRAMSVVDERIATALGARPNFRALLHELSRVTPGTVRLSSISLSADDGAAVGTLGGFAFVTDVESGRTDLEAYVEKIRQSPLFDDIALGGVQAGELGDLPGQQFSLTFDGQLIPPVEATATAETGGPGP